MYKMWRFTNLQQRLYLSFIFSNNYINDITIYEIHNILLNYTYWSLNKHQCWIIMYDCPLKYT